MHSKVVFRPRNLFACTEYSIDVRFVQNIISIYWIKYNKSNLHVTISEKKKKNKSNSIAGMMAEKHNQARNESNSIKIHTRMSMERDCGASIWWRGYRVTGILNEVCYWIPEKCLHQGGLWIQSTRLAIVRNRTAMTFLALVEAAVIACSGLGLALIAP